MKAVQISDHGWSKKIIKKAIAIAMAFFIVLYVLITIPNDESGLKVNYLVISSGRSFHHRF